MTKERKYNLIIAILAGAFFFVYSYLSSSVWLSEWFGFKQIIFNWPDSNANFCFARVLSQQGTLAVFEPLNQLTDNLLHTRSINVFDSHLVPVTFLPGIVIFALAGKIFGTAGILFLTPLLASLTVYMVYRLSYHVFKDLNLSLITALLLLPLGPWLYFANIVMLPTIMFIFLVVAGFLGLSVSLQRNHWAWWLISSALLSLAIVVRPTEIVWLGIISLIVLYWNRSKIDYKKILACLLVFVVIVLTALYLNKLIYGAYLASGYFNLQSGEQGFSGQGTNYFKLLLAPFGFDIKQIFYNFGKYFIKLNWFPFIFAIFGFVLLAIKRFKEKKDTVWCKYHKLNFLIFVLILIYYGSWDIADPLVKNLNTISISYVRYFLPLYILILPLAAYTILFITKKNKFISGGLILALAIFSWHLAFYSPNDGLLATKSNLESYRWQYQQVHKIVEDDAIIMTDRSDKVFFPAYRVIVPQGDLPLWSRVSNIIDTQSIYYFSNKSEEEINKIRPEANSNGIAILDPIEFDDGFKLYKIIRLSR